MTEEVIMVPSEIIRPPNEQKDDLRSLMLRPMTLTKVPPFDGPQDGSISVTTGMRWYSNFREKRALFHDSPTTWSNANPSRWGGAIHTTVESPMRLIPPFNCLK
jgi:hypothetical protein